MATLESSLKLKASSTKAPAKVGADSLVKPDVTAPEGQSGGIAKSKQVKNAGSTSSVVPGNPRGTKFINSIGGSSNSDKTVGYF